MSDIVAQLQVLAQDSGCVLDLSAILDLAVCPKINLKTTKPHKVEEKDDYICVTPTKPTKPATPTEYAAPPKKRCPNNKCFEVHEEVCKKNHVALDLEILVILGLLTEEELEKYLKTMGDMDEDDHLNLKDDDDVKMDPLLSLGVGDDKSILDAEVLGEDGLLNVKLGDNQLLNLGGDGALLNLGGKNKGLLGLGGVLRRGDYGYGPGPNHPHGHSQKLADIQVGGQKDDDEAAIDVDVLTHSRLRRHYGAQKLADVQVGGQKDDDEAVIDVDVLTHPKRADKGLLDLQVGGEKDDDDATIDVDLLTTNKPKPVTTAPVTNGNGSNGNGSNGNGSNGNGSNGNGNQIVGGNDNHPDNYYLSVYQPVCNKGFKKEHSNAAEKCHAQDANHCLAICHSKGALLTLKADAKVGDVANILVCAAIEFNNSEEGDNCSYYVAPEHEPCQDDQLEEKKDCYTFVRN